MANMMKDWIAPAAKQELFNAYETLKPEYIAGQILQRYPYDCGPQGLTVHLTKARRVQLIDFHGKYEHPFEVTLSDGTTRIRATLSSTCAAELGSGGPENIRRKLGAVLNISEYYMLVFRVMKFKLLGSEVQRPFCPPTSVEEQESLWDLFSNIDGLLAGSEAHHTNDDALDIQSQAGDVDDRESSPIAMATQATSFATQIHTRKAEPPSRGTNKGAVFLALLSNGKRKEAEMDSRGVVRAATTSRSTVNAHIASIFQPVSDSRKADMSSKLDSKANSQSSMPSSDSKKGGLPLNDSNSPISASLLQDDDSEKENSLENLKRVEAPVSIAKPKDNFSAATPKQPDVQELLVARIPEGNPFDGMKRVPRSYVRIPANQQAILDSKNSWWQPPDSGRPSYASLPPDVVQALHSHKARQKTGKGRNDIDDKELSAAESSAGFDEDSDGEREEEEAECLDEDAGRARADSESILLVPSENKVASEGVVSDDEESVVSWGESHYSRPEAGEMEVPGTFLEGSNLGNVQQPDPITASTGTGIRPDPEPTRSSPLTLTIPTAAKLRPKYNYEFPSSSPGGEDELEVAVPYAIDDEVDENQLQVDAAPKTSQELPSTAASSEQMIQVEHTPAHNVALAVAHGKQPDPELHTQAYIKAKMANDDISSQLIIPDSSRKHGPLSQRAFPANPNKRKQFASSSAEVEPVLKGDRITYEDDLAQEQDFSELKSSQCEESKPIDSSPLSRLQHEHSMPPRTEQQKVPLEVSSILQPPQQPTSSFETSLAEMGFENDKPPSVTSSPPKMNAPKRRVSEPLKVRKLKVSKSIRTRAVAAGQVHSAFRDMRGLIKAARHEFHARHPSPVAEPSTVLIAQSQSNPSRPEPLSPVQASNDAGLLQSSNDLVRSSIPDKSERRYPADISEAVPTNSISPELSQSLIIEGPHPETSAEEDRLELADDPDMTQDDSYSTNMKGFTSPKNLDQREHPNHPEPKLETGVSLSNSKEEDVLTNEEEPADEEDHDNEQVGQVEQEYPCLSLQLKAFDEFKSIYPSYSGREKDFISALIYIEWLGENNGDDFLRASLWDDFIRTLAAEYLEYMQEVRHSGEKIRTGFAYFNKLDKPPIFQRRYITPDSLQSAISSLDPEKVGKIRLQFSKPKTALPNPAQPESSHGSPSSALIQSQIHQGRENNVTDEVVETTRPSTTEVPPMPKPLPAPERASTKRPFFETASQLQAAKKPRISSSPRQQEVEVEVPSTSKSRRSLPWTQNSPLRPQNALSSIYNNKTLSTGGGRSPQQLNTPTKNPRKRSAVSAPTSGRIQATTTEAPEQRRSASSASFSGTPASPILGETPKYRSFHEIDIRASSTGSPPLAKSKSLFKKPSVPVSKTALQRQCRGRVSESHARKVEGWLHNTETDDDEAARKTKKDRYSELKSSERRSTLPSTVGSAYASPTKRPRDRLPTTDAKTRRERHVVSTAPLQRPMASTLTSTSISNSRVSNLSATATGTGMEVRRKRSFREFLRDKKRRSSGLLSSMASSTSTPDAKAGRSGSGKKVNQVQHAEPETQAWGI